MRQTGTEGDREREREREREKEREKVLRSTRTVLPRAEIRDATVDTFRCATLLEFA